MSEQGKKLIILGAGGGISSMINVARELGYDVTALIDPAKDGEELYGIPVFATLDRFNIADYDLALGVGDNGLRERIYQKTINDHPNAHFPKLIHPTAYIAGNVEIGEGTVAFPGAMVGSESTIGRFCWLNSRASIDHDGLMQDFSSLAPGVIAAGRVHIGTRSVVSVGAVIKHYVTIGDDTVIGAASYVHHDIGDNVVAYGSPAKPVRSRTKEDGYL